MLARKYRISSDQFPRVTRGKIFMNESFRIIFFSDETLVLPRFAVIVPKKVAKTAVARNRLRRKIYALLESSVSETKNGFISIFPKTHKETDQVIKDFKKLITCLKK